MKKSFKILFVILSIFTALFFGGAVGTIVTQITLIEPAAWGALFTTFLPAAASFNVLYSGIIFYASIVIGIALMILSLVLIKKNIGLKIVCAIFSFAIALLGVMVASILAHSNVFINFASTETAVLIGTYAIVILSGLYCIFVIVLVVLSIVFTRNAVQDSDDIFTNEIPAENTEKLETDKIETLAAPADPIEYEDLSAEPIPVFIPEPEPEIEPEPEVPLSSAAQVPPEVVRDIVREMTPTPAPAPTQEPIDPKELAAMIRDIVRDEIARNNAQQPKQEARPTTDNHSIVGATFGGPLIVQYFGNGMSPIPQNIEPVSRPAPAPVSTPVQVPTPTPAIVKSVKSEPASPVEKVEATPVVSPIAKPEIVTVTPVVEEPAAPKAPIIRIPFEERMLSAEKEMKENYNAIKNEILSYGVKSRVSSSGDTFRLHRKTYVKLTIAGKSLKLYFALNPDDYKDSTIPVQDAGNKAIYAEIPLVFKVKSALSMKRCKELIQTVMENDGLEQGEVGTVNWVKELKVAAKDKSKKDLKDEK